MSDLGKTFEEVGQNYFNSEMKPVTRVYADLEYLQDLRFGALLRGVTCQREMDYVHAMISRYNNRYDQKTARYFPVLKKTDEELEQMLKTDIEKDRICFLAPWTSVYSHLLEVIDLYQQHNKRMLEKVPEMKLVINVSDVDYPIELQNELINTISRLMGISVEVQQMERYIADVKEYLSYDIMFLYDYGKFVNTFPTQFVGEGRFTDTRIIAMPYIQPGLGHKPEDYEYVLTSTEKGMDIYCDFSFLRSNITLNIETKE